MIYSCLKILKPPARALYLQRFAVFPFAFSLPSMFFIIIDFVVKPALFIASMHLNPSGMSSPFAYLSPMMRAANLFFSRKS